MRTLELIHGGCGNIKTDVRPKLKVVEMVF